MSEILPVITGFGGYNAAGRSSGHHAFRRTVIDALPADARDQTLAALAALAGPVREGDADGDTDSHAPAATPPAADTLLAGTLIRQLDPRRLNTAAVSGLEPVAGSGAARINMPVDTLPDPLPEGWVHERSDGGIATLRVAGGLYATRHRDLGASAAGQLPDGFDPGALYRSRSHPRGLAMTIAAVSDALRATGISWQAVAAAVAPEQVAVFASSSMSQLDDFSNRGLLQARLLGRRVTSRQLPFGFNTMVADFINAYVLGSVGFTSSITGACASFLYNLAAAVSRLRAGQCRVAVVGVSEAPLVPEIIEGYAAMNALASDANLARLDGTDTPDLTRACRPFGENCGFTLAESAQFVVLMADDLAMELGADIYGAVPEVFIAADGVKSSISAPGPGNYLTLSRAVGCAAAILGDTAVRQRSFVHAHGSSTPKNRVTESLILDRVAGAFGIDAWPITAIKSAVGHSLGAASGDQLASALGTFAWDIVPGIKTIDAVADDVAQTHLDIRRSDLQGAPYDLAFINSKGFGGNNATAPVISAGRTERMLAQRHGGKASARWQELREEARAAAADYDAAMRRATLPAIYRYGEPVTGDDDIGVTRDALTLPGDQAVALKFANPWRDMV